MSNPIYHVFADGPAMVAPYSHAVETGDFLFLTGQMPIAADGTVPDGIEAQTRTVIANLREVMARSGFGDADIVQVRVFLCRFEEHYEQMNQVYLSHFLQDKLPARTCVGVTALARGCEIEIDAIAKRRS